MQFQGHLLLPGESGPGLKVNLDVAAHHLAVESDGGGLGAWPLEAVDVERLQGDIFALTVAGEALRFVADDTIAFAYSGVPSIERLSRRRPRSGSTLRSMFDWIWNGPDEAKPPPAGGETSGEEGRRDTLTEDHSSFVVDEPVDREPVTTVETTEVAQDLDEEIPDPGSPDVGEDLATAESCPAMRSDGRRCQSPILTSSGYCYAHDPKRAFEDRYKAAQEARAQLKRDATGRLNRIYGRLDKAMRQVERGELDPETAMAMAQLARTMCAILDVDDPKSERR